MLFFKKIVLFICISLLVFPTYHMQASQSKNEIQSAHTIDKRFQVEYSSPSPGKIDVLKNEIIKITFNEKFKISNNKEIQLRMSGELIDVTITTSNKELIITPTEPLLPSKSYIVSLGKDSVLSVKGEGLSQKLIIEFKSAPEEYYDLNYIGSSFLNGNILENSNESVRVFFNADINEGENYDSISIVSPTNEKIAAEISIDKSNLILKLNGDLKSSTEYNVIVPPNALINNDDTSNNKEININFKYIENNKKSVLSNNITMKSMSLIPNLKKSAFGESHYAIIDENGMLWMWGDNSEGQLGDGTTVSSTVPVRVASNIISVSVGAYHTVALTTNHEVLVWGANKRGQLTGSSQKSILKPKLVKNNTNNNPLNNIVAVSAGSEYTLVLCSDGSLLGWGANSYGQLGDGTRIDRNEIVKVLDTTGSGYLKEIKSISAGYETSTALNNNGSVLSWGKSDYGALGVGGIYGNTTLPQFALINNVDQISSGGGFTLAVHKDGTLWAWGFNHYGTLGNGTRWFDSSEDAPVQVKDSHFSGGSGVMTDVVDVSAGGISQAVALKSDGSVWAWGASWGDLPLQLNLDQNIVVVSSGDGIIALTDNNDKVWISEFGSEEFSNLEFLQIKDSQYTYDKSGRLSTIKTSFGSKVFIITFQYDKNGNLISKKVTSE
ncbi:hypothetical protein CA600_10430 [Paenibacillus sp. VTT E-133280]|uniref:RCC1 domain-containing protein n=1 Tax=Paenibacillus sp. VTT E-133280 TaxID=1986222 RepID=UPI000BA12122|nr:Ig-like domain-containing protein [Paenibacillus sp. VTT E-133280]OZQ66767.1 hypothetical protein CA600_10430 [Paenibacillus sp. VTT E-133280]